MEEKVRFVGRSASVDISALTWKSDGKLFVAGVAVAYSKSRPNAVRTPTMGAMSVGGL